MILCIGTTPAAQRVMVFPRLTIDAVNRAATTLDGAAGKSVNVAKVLQAMDADPVLIGFFGGPRGEQLRLLLKARGLELDVISVQAPTRECVTVIDQSAGTITELVEESQPVEPVEYGKLIQIVRRRVPNCLAAVMSGTIASGGPADLYLECVQLAHQAGALSVLDASGSALTEALKASPGLVKPNRLELERTVGRSLPDEAALQEAIRELHSRGAQRVVVTAGAEPALAFDGKTWWRVTAPTLTAVNPIGSGDAFMAALAWRLTLGDDLGEACRWGSAAGAANALTLMAGEIDRRQVETLLPQVRLERV